MVKKSLGHLLTGTEMTYQFISNHCHAYPVVVMCRVLQVATSG